MPPSVRSKFNYSNKDSPLQTLADALSRDSQGKMGWIRAFVHDPAAQPQHPPKINLSRQEYIECANLADKVGDPFSRKHFECCFNVLGAGYTILS